MIRTDLVISSPIFLVGLVEVLNSAGIKVVAVRESPDEEPSWLADAALIDIDALTAGDGLSQIATTARTTAVLVLVNGTGNDRDYLAAGASGVISKRESGARIVEAIHAITAGYCVGPDGVGERPAVERPQSPGQQLSEREEQVLRRISCGLTHSQIATRLRISPHTVDTYVKRIRAKLGVGNKAELTRAALLGGMVRGTNPGPDQPPAPMTPAA
ncbi:helix-turn-helix transcriptional regulator [Micromonospora chokoriensis]|uniref:helix-turn-helix transcriptional regulator n=1 Tax=Micromonospora chokoriensis TaxID=356851 RepID=UPI000AF7A0D0|nr:response regulator transcription factor [Micromonospora chokoriensis]